MTFDEMWDKAINADIMNEPWTVHLHLKQGVVLAFKAETHDEMEEAQYKALKAFYERGEGDWKLL